MILLGIFSYINIVYSPFSGHILNLFLFFLADLQYYSTEIEDFAVTHEIWQFAWTLVTWNSVLIFEIYDELQHLFC